jgi:hypothetical protein
MFHKPGDCFDGRMDSAQPKKKKKNIFPTATLSLDLAKVVNTSFFLDAKDYPDPLLTLA